MNQIHKHWNYIVKIFALGWIGLTLLSFSCNLPFLNQGGGMADEGLENSLAESGLLFIDEVVVTEDQVTISYQVLPEDDPELVMSGWINALLAAAEAEPDAKGYLLITSLSGEPYLEIQADALEVQGLAADEIPLDLFLERLVIRDLRPLPVRAMNELEVLGLENSQVSQFGKTLSVQYNPAAAANQAELMEEWWSIFAVLSDLELGVDQIEIRAVMPDNSVFVVEGEVKGLEAFGRGEITTLQYLAGLTITEEPVEGE